ncbi:hypothetical protein ACPFP2_24100 [Micromonospora citrea]|uniref:hypothetical protein n=1 Tax=Micromonospora citrea TaxID=47855 RepID=UPI003C5174F7
MLGIFPAADRADATLLGEEFLELLLAHAVATAQVVLATGFAEAAATVGPTTVGAELIERLPLIAVATTAEAVPIIRRPRCV